MRKNMIYNSLSGMIVMIFRVKFPTLSCDSTDGAIKEKHIFMGTIIRVFDLP